MLKKFLNYIYKNRLIILISLGIFLFFYFGEFSFAETTGGGNTSVTQDNQSISNKVKLADGIFVFLASMLGIMTQLVGVFLNPNWTSGAVFGLTDNLHELWILVSNVVYFIFILILIIIAFLNIIGQGKGVFELKQALPRLIIGILMVPFSWLLIQALLSVSAVLTASVLTIPFDTFENTTAVKSLFDTKVCVDGLVTQTKQVKKNENQQDNNGNTIYTTHNEEGKQVTYICKQHKKAREILNSPHGVYGILNIYTYGIMALDETMKAYSDSLGDKITTLFSLLTKLGFDLVFILIYAILVIALFFALFVRGIWLWIYMIFSPVFGLLIFFGKGTSGFGKGGDKFNIKELVSLAMVPVYVAGALSFGLLFIIIAGQGMKSGVVNLINITNNADKTSTLHVLSTFHFTVDGDFANAANIKATQSFNQIFAGGFGIIGTIILQIFGLLVLWIGVMAALKASKITENITEPIRSFGSKMGGLLMDAPKYIPLPGTKMSLANMEAAASSAKSTFDTQMKAYGSNLGADIGTTMAHLMGANTKGALQALNRMDSRLKQIGPLIKANDPKKAAAIMREVFSEVMKSGKYKDVDAFIKDKAVFNETMERLGKNIGLSEEEIKKLQTVNNGRMLDTTWIEIARNKDPSTKDAMDLIDNNINGNAYLSSYLNDIAKNSASSSSSGDSTKYNNLLNAQVVSETNGLKEIKFDGGKETVKIDTTDERIKERDLKKFTEHLKEVIKDKYKGRISQKQLDDIMKNIGAERSIEDVEKELKKSKGIKIINHNLNINTITGNRNTDENKIEIVFKNKTGGNTIIGAKGGELKDNEIETFTNYLNHIKENGEDFSKDELKQKLKDMGLNKKTIDKIIFKI